MKRRRVHWLAAVGLLAAADTAAAALDSRKVRELPFPQAVQDTAVAEGRRLFVLLEGGEVRVFDGTGNLQGSLSVGKDAERISASPDGELLYVTSRAEKTVSVWAVGLVQTIDAAGSPFHGPADAPVVLAVYSDFQ